MAAEAVDGVRVTAVAFLVAGTATAAAATAARRATMATELRGAMSPAGGTAGAQAGRRTPVVYVLPHGARAARSTWCLRAACDRGPPTHFWVSGVWRNVARARAGAAVLVIVVLAEVVFATELVLHVAES